MAEDITITLDEPLAPTIVIQAVGAINTTIENDVTNVSIVTEGPLQPLIKVVETGPQGPPGADGTGGVGTGGPIDSTDITDATATGRALITAPSAPSALSTIGGAPTSHNHTVANVTGLQALLDGKQAAGSYADSVHTHAVADTTGLQTALDGKAALSHAHTIANVTGLQASLDAKQASGSYAAAVHTHTSSAITDFATAVDARIQNVVAAAPAALDTLDELAAALGDDANFAGTVTTALAGKAPIVHTHAIADVTGLQSTINLKAPIDSPTFTGTVSGITKSHVGLSNADNTSDANKPVSIAQQAAFDLKAPLVSPAFTGTPTGITKTHVGLGNVDNTSDANKPVSTATTTALGLKADDSAVVKLTGAQTVAGVKTFSSAPVIPVGTSGQNAAQVLSLLVGDAVPAGTPAGTIIVRH